MPMSTSSPGASAERFDTLTFTVTTPASSLEIVTPVTSGALAASPDGSRNEPEFAAEATLVSANAAIPVRTASRPRDPFISATVVRSAPDAIPLFTSTARRRRRLTRAPRVPRVAEDVPARGGQGRQRAARLLQLHPAALA